MDTTTPDQYSQARLPQNSHGLEVLQRYMRWEGGDTVLDVGCGTGEMSQYMSRQPGVTSVVGFDLSTDYISYASQRNSSDKVSYHVANVSDPSTFKSDWSGAFSKVVNLEVLHWVQDKPKALKAMHSCLKPHGELLIVCHADTHRFCKTVSDMTLHPRWKAYLKSFDPKLYPWSSDDFYQGHSQLLEECGFEVLACGQIEHRPQSFESKGQLRAFMRVSFAQHGHIPQELHEEFFDSLEKVAMERQLLSFSGDGCPQVDDDKLVVHARKV
ncbi:uncharacterized protein [Branchiostoma lanceolatum]|uniref:uncharacterized protein n=1 Tax=Branchiostoma lanceolatum TaxID=7740 RepID=UPI003453CC16